MHFDMTLGSGSHEVYLAREGDTVKVEVDGEIVDAEVSGGPRSFTVTIGDRSFTVDLGTDLGTVTVDDDALPLDVANFRPGEAPGAHGVGGAGAAVKPPMPGTVVELKVAEGDTVESGDVLLILEAMKMQNEITAPTAGKVAEVHVEEGANVEAKDVLVTIEGDDD